MIRKFITCWVFLLLSVIAHAQTNPLSSGSDNYLSFLLEKRSLPFDTISASSFVAFSDDEDDAWKSWRVVENYSFGKDRGSLPMIADLNSLHPYFRDQILQLINACRSQGITLEVVESFRTHAKQGEYFGMGRKYTRSSGGKSKHQYGLAVDVVAVVDGVPQWDNLHLWRKIGVTGERLGLRWGGRWRAPYDPAHFEWSGGMTTYHLAVGVQPYIPKSKAHLYPCIEEEVQRLQRSYSSWETEQAVISRSQPKGGKKAIASSVGSD
jgi:peptidoglycan L-alanyl-D-glutamate endopeptidase CwlK